MTLEAANIDDALEPCEARESGRVSARLSKDAFSGSSK